MTWSDFKWENGYEAPQPIDSLREPVRFGRAEYEAAFADAYGRVAAFPYDGPVHRGRRFLWPWQWGWKFPRG